MVRKYQIPLLISIIALAFILRFWNIQSYPPSLFIDELSNGYNAYSILKTGRDEYGDFLPLTFKSFGDYNPALSVLTLVPSIALFDLNDFAVRFPSALLGTLTVLITYLLTRQLLKNKKISILAAFLLAISPWHLHFSRYDHEANFMVFWVVLALWLFFKWQISKIKHNFWLTLSLISFGLALNSYQGAKIYIPLLIAGLFWVFRQDLLNLKFKLAKLAIILVVSALPFILNFQNSLIRGQSVGIFGKSESVSMFISGYLSHFSPIFLFISGDSIGRHSVSGMGQLLVFELPLVAIGLFVLLKKKNKDAKFLITWLLLTPIPAALATPAPHGLRTLSLSVIFSIIAAIGLYQLSIFNISKAFKRLAIVLLILIAFYNTITYFHLYYKHYPGNKAVDWAYGYKQTISYINSVKDDYSSIAITNYAGWPYIAVLFYTKFDPAVYHSQSQDKTAFDKFEFFGPSWSKTKPGKALIVTPFWQAHPPTVLKNIYLPNDDLRFIISQEE